MLIRRLSPNDASAFRALRLEGLARHPDAFGASYDDEAGQPLERFAERLAGNVVLGGYDGTEALRGVIGIRKATAPKVRHIATIWGMYVSPGSRGSGLGDRLVQAAIAEARASCTSVRLSVVTSNAAALRLYERAGFTIWAVDRGALCVDGVFLDEALMRRDFA